MYVLQFYTALLALAKSPDALYGSGIRIEGELGIAETLRTLVTQLDIDLESLIAPVVGGTAAHQANRLTDSVANWLHRSADALQQNTKEYLQEEAQLVPPKVLHHEFSEQVSDLREGVDRAEARLRRLEQRISSAAAAKTKP